MAELVQVFDEKNSIVEYQNDTHLLLLGANERLHMYGMTEIQVVAGKINVNGYILESQPLDEIKNWTPLFVPLFDPAVTITVAEKTAQSTKINKKIRRLFNNHAKFIGGSCAIIRLRKVPNADSFTHESLKSAFEFSSKNLWNNEGFPLAGAYIFTKIVGETHLFIEPDQWKQLKQSQLSNPNSIAPDQPSKTLGQGQSSSIFLICGSKNSGKSTFCRYAINSLLSSGIQEICYLECDVGQTEFTPSCIISLVSIKSPLLGPPETHLQDPILSYFFGDNSPEYDPRYYMSCIVNVIDYYRADERLNKLPLIINTCGWLKGVGGTVLSDIFTHSRPKFVVQLTKNASEKVQFHNSESINAEFIVLPMAVNTQAILPFTGTDKRKRVLVQYLGGSRIPLVLQPLFRIPISKLRVKCVTKSVAPSKILYALNASIVALVKDDHVYNNIGPGELECQDKRIPQYLVETPLSPCLGLGVVRAIDEDGMIYIVTSLHRSLLKSVNTLLKGNLELPHALLIEGAAVRAPYLSVDTISGSSTGTKALSGRNVKRRGVETVSS